MYSFRIYISRNYHCKLDKRWFILCKHLCKARCSSSARFITVHESKYLSQLLFFFSNIKFAECTRRVYHLGYRIFLGVGGRGSVRKLLPIKKRLTWFDPKDKTWSYSGTNMEKWNGYCLKNDRNTLLMGYELSLFSTNCNWWGHG